MQTYNASARAMDNLLTHCQMGELKVILRLGPNHVKYSIKYFADKK